MKKLLIVFVAALLVAPVFAGSVTTVGNTDLEVSGKLRIRWDYYSNIYDFQDHQDDPGVDYCSSWDCDDDFSYTPWRANIVLKALVTRNVDVVLNIQNVGFFGSSGYFEDGYIEGPSRGIAPWDEAGAGYNADWANWTSLFEGYIHIRNAWDSNWSFKLGRQAVSLGNEFLVGDNDWYDGTSFDGLRADWGNDQGDIVIFWYKLYTQTGDDIANEDDGDLRGVFTTWDITDRQGIDAYILHLVANVDAMDQADPDFTSLNLGVRWFSKEVFNGFDWTAELVWQDNDFDWGTGAMGDDPGGGGIALDGEIGYSFDNEYEPRLAFGLTWITGDDDWTDDDMDGFWRMFGDSHGKWGNADLGYSSAASFETYSISSPFFLASGSIIPQLNYEMKANDSINWGANLVYFLAAEDEFSTGPDTAFVIDWKALELDAWLNYQYSEHLGSSFNLSYISPDLETGDSGDPMYDWDLDAAYRAYANFVAAW